MTSKDPFVFRDGIPDYDDDDDDDDDPGPRCHDCGLYHRGGVLLMSNVASDYPARREVDGRGERVWFKAAVRDKSETWGWTANPAQAHPDYQVKLADDGSLVTWVGDPWAPNPSNEGKHCTKCETVKQGPPDDWPSSEVPACPIYPARSDACAVCGQLGHVARACPAPIPSIGPRGGIRFTTTTKGTNMPRAKAAQPTITQVDDTTGEDLPGVSLAADTDIEAPRFTEWSHYPLPPLPPRAKVTYDGYGRYKLPSPSTGRPTGFSRATTIASTLEETYNLNRWKRRQAVKAIFTALAQVELADSPTDQFDIAGHGDDLIGTLAAVREALSVEDDRALDAAVDHLDNITGGRDAAELGEAVHAWLEAVDCGTVLPAQVPEMFAPYVKAYRAVLAKHGLVAVPEYVERIVLNDQGEETVVGTIDRIYRVVTTGSLVLGDVKTSKTLEYSWLPYAVQFAVYGYATRMFAADGSGWEPMPELDLSACYCLHVPSDQPERAACITFDLFWGGTTMVASLEARRLRKAAAKAVPFVHEIPVPSKEALRYVAARDALLDIADADELGAVWESFQDVWTDDLTELGEHVAELLNVAV